MTKEEIAKRLNNSEYPFRCPIDLVPRLADYGFVVVVGASDDLMCFYGAINDEISCFGGGNAYLNKNGLLRNECEDDDCPYFKEQLNKVAIISAIWNQAGYAWQYETKISHATFDVLEDGEKYCRGIVFNRADIS